MEFLYCFHDNNAMSEYSAKYKILVCVDSNPFNNIIVQKALENAEMFECSIEAIYVETSKHYKLDDKEVLQLKKNIKKIESQGIPFHQVTGLLASETILQFAEENGFNKIFLGISVKTGLSRLIKFSLHSELVKNKLNIEINTLPLPKKKHKSQFLLLLTESQNLIGYLSSAITISAITLINRLLDINIESGYSLGLPNEAMILLLGVLFCSVRFGFLPGLLASILGFFSLNFFFTNPIMEFSINGFAGYISLVIFLLSAILTSTFGGLSRQQIRALRLREAQLKASVRINEVVANVNDEAKVLGILENEISNISNTKSIILLLDEEKNIYKQSSPMTGFTMEDRKLLKEVIDNEEVYRLNILNKSNFHFEPIFSDEKFIGILAVEESKDLARNTSKLYESLAKQCGLIFGKVNLAKEIEASKIREEREQLRSALLSSVSHDLKTPLASIIGSLSAIKQMGESLGKEASEELLLTALEEAERLNGFISNILDMTKLESKAVELNQDWFSFVEIANQVLKTLKFRAKDHKIKFSKPDKDIMLNVDRMLFAQVLQNIIDNAIKYSPVNSEVEISIGINENDKPVISITDQGGGISDKDKPKVFDKFTRLKKKDKQVAGTGLGLAICKIVIERHKGKVFIEDNQPKGTIFKIELEKYQVS